MTGKYLPGFTALVALALAVVFSAVPLSSASAHPHVWIDMTTALQFDDEGRVAAVEIRWTFDEFYSAFAVEDAPKKNGTYDEALLAGLTSVNLENLAEYNYFLEVTTDGAPVKTVEARDGKSTWDDETGRLTLAFTVPLAEPRFATPASPVKFRVYDPSYYISIDYVKDDPIRLTGGPHDGCTLATDVPDAENVWTSLPETAFTSATSQLGAYFATTAALTCAPRT